jgi:site-specific DNA-methyltransferase (adenine-specific)
MNTVLVDLSYKGGLTYSAAYEIYKKNKNNNLFEEVIDLMMMDNFPEEYKKTILSLPLEKKRMAILSILDKDRNLFTKIKALINGGTYINKMVHIKDVVMMLREYVKVGEVEKKKYGEVMTPLEFVKEMLSKLPDEVWTNPNLKFLDPANGTGPYPLMILYKLMKGLEKWEPSEEKRYKHIVENMIYVCELQPKNMYLYMCAVDPWDMYKLNIYTGSFLTQGFDKHMKEVWGIDKFDIILGNPPYQEELVTKKGSAKPLYNLFTEKSIKISNTILFVTPSRWFAGGKGLDKFRELMLKSKKIKLLKHFEDASKIFDDVDITGGISYFLFENFYNGDCSFNEVDVDLSKYDIIVNPRYYSIIDKVTKYDGLSKICKGQSYSGITTNDKRLSIERINDDYIKCYVSKVNGYEKWIDKNNIRRNINFSKWKVITARANGEYPKFGNKFIGAPFEICNQSYIIFEVGSENEANYLLSYLNTKFANFLLSLRKISQDIKPDTCRWIPYIKMDKHWTDDKIVELFSLTEEEKKEIGI